MDGELPLPLPSLSISGLRGFKSLSIPQLGRVTLLTGRNGVGKTTVLDAIRVYAAATHDSPWRLTTLLAKKLEQQDEWISSLDEDGDEVYILDYAGLFHGRNFGQSISIGPKNGDDNVRLAVYKETDLENLSEEEKEKLIASSPQPEDTGIQPLLLKFNERPKYFLPRVRRRGYVGRHRFFRKMNDNDEQSSKKPNCIFISPHLLDDNSLGKYIDKIALTEKDDELKEAICRAFDYEIIYGIARIGEGDKFSPSRVIVKLSKQEPRVPLKSLGDGTVRVLGITVALLNSRNGFFLIDEIENGIHYSVHKSLWKTILKAAKQYNIQVVATTHSWDAVSGFAEALEDLGMEEDGVIIRIDKPDREGGKHHAVKYTGDSIKTVSKYDIEVR